MLPGSARGTSGTSGSPVAGLGTRRLCQESRGQGGGATQPVGHPELPIVLLGPEHGAEWPAGRAGRCRGRGRTQRDGQVAF